MARVTQEHVDARRSQILRAAARQFGLKGLEPGAATIEDIAKEAGLSKGSIYTYFKNKDELLVAIKQFGEQQDTALFEDAQGGPATSWDAFWDLAREVWDSMLDPTSRELNMLTFGIMLVELRSGESDLRPVEGPIAGLSALRAGSQR